MTRETPQYPLRMPDELREQVERAAKENGRSLNAEICERLRESLSPRVVHVTGEGVPIAYIQESPAEAQMLRLFRRMPAEKQLALLSLFA